jgi:IS4 transposase
MQSKSFEDGGQTGMTPLDEMIQDLFESTRNPRYAAMKRDRVAAMKAAQAKKADSRTQDAAPAAPEPTERPETQATVLTPQKKAEKSVGRLPHGSLFEVRWDGVRMEWSGYLTVPGSPPLSGTAGSLHGICCKLGRTWKRQQKAPVKALELEAQNGT